MYLPTPPTNEEKYSYINQNKKVIYFFSLVSFVFIFIGMILFISLSAWLLFFLAILILTGAYLGINLAIHIFSEEFDYKKYQKIIDNFKGEYPTVDIYLPVCGEPLDILKNTQKYVSQIDYPKDKLKVWVLDDKGNDELKKTTLANGFNYLSRKNKGELKKAGNLRYAFKRTKADFFLVLDADFCPRKDILKEMIPIALSDNRISIVQSPQFFRIESNQNKIEKGATYVQELFYRLVQVNRDTWNASICVGSNALYRRSALENRGGTAPIDYSEDVHTGFYSMCDGYYVRYIPINLACGTNPDNAKTFFSQQYRWCMGSISLLLNKEFWTSPLTKWQKLCFSSGFLYYISTAIGVIVNILPTLIMVWFFPELFYWYNIVFIIPSLLTNFIVLPLWSRNKFTVQFIKARMIAYYSHLFAIRDKLTNNRMAWVISGDNKAKVSRYDEAKRFIYSFTSVYTLLLIAGIIVHYDTIGLNFIPSALLFTFNTYHLLRGLE